MMKTKKKDNRGGARAGAGRKRYGDDEEVKKQVTIRLYPSQQAKLKELYGTIQAAIESLL